MKMTTKLKQIALSLTMLIGLVAFALPVEAAFADTPANPGDCNIAGGRWVEAGYNGGSTMEDAHCVTGSAIPTSVGSAVSCPPGQIYLSGSDTVCCPAGTESDSTKCVFAKYVNPIVRLLSVVAGIAVVIGIIMGGIQYSASAGDPQKAAQAKGKITKALFGLVAFLFLYSTLQFFSPGGISSTPTPDTARGGTIANQCSKEFLGLKPWFAYLKNNAFESNDSCNITNFSLIGEQDSQGNTTKPSSLLPVLLVIADDLIRIAGLVAVAFVIMGGIQFVTSQGEPEKTKQARGAIINALIGVLVAIVAASVVSYIGSQLSS
jgi:hypothetical protein